MKIDKREITAALIAFSLVITGVFVSSKKKELVFSRENFSTDIKTRHKVARYIVSHKSLEGPAPCAKYSADPALEKNKQACVRYLLGDPNKTEGNKFIYTVLSDEIILWRKYLVVEFNEDHTAITSVKLLHFL